VKGLTSNNSNNQKKIHYGGYIVDVKQNYLSQYHKIHPELPEYLPILQTKYCSGRFYVISKHAITNVLSEYGSQSKGTVAGTIEDIKDKIKGTIDTKALPASQVEVLNPPTATGELAPVTVTGQTPSDVTGTNIISPNAVTSTTTPTPSPTVVEQPAAPAPVAETIPPPQDKAILDLIASPATPPLEPVTVAGTKTADITNTDIINTIAAETTPVATTPVIDTPVVPTPPKLENVEVSGKALPKATDITDTDVINAITAEKKPDAVLQRVEVSGKALPTDITKTDIIEEPAKLQDVTVTGKREEPLALETKTITGKADGTLAPVTITAKADEPVVTPEEKKTEEPVPKDKPYKPDLFILGGKKPKAPPTKSSDSVLSQALGTTTGLTASRGAGEIEDPSTGKKKRKVWNEETLRLKDALGV
jgi:hypothetical protein